MKGDQIQDYIMGLELILNQQAAAELTEGVEGAVADAVDLLEQRLKVWPNVLKQQVLCFACWMESIGLKVLRCLFQTIQQEGQKRHFIFLGDGHEASMKLIGIGAVVGRQSHANQQGAGAFAFAQFKHGLKIGPHGWQRKPAQAVIGTEFDQYDVRAVLAQQCRQAIASARSCFTRDAGIDDAQFFPFQVRFVLEFVLKQFGPCLVLPNAKSGRERVAQDENRCRGDCCGQHT